MCTFFCSTCPCVPVVRFSFYFIHFIYFFEDSAPYPSVPSTTRPTHPTWSERRAHPCSAVRATPIAGPAALLGITEQQLPPSPVKEEGAIRPGGGMLLEARHPEVATALAVGRAGAVALLAVAARKTETRLSLRVTPGRRRRTVVEAGVWARNPMCLSLPADKSGG